MCQPLTLVTVHGFSTAAGLKSGQSNRKETEDSDQSKLQITSTKCQINLKSQYPITETQFHFPGGEGYFSGSHAPAWEPIAKEDILAAGGRVQRGRGSGITA
jgi:hypothetical protein